MVKGISRQVIVVNSPDKKLFDQAIFILREDALAGGGVTEEALLREAKALLRSGAASGAGKNRFGPVWAFAGAAATAAVWLLTALL